VLYPPTSPCQKLSCGESETGFIVDPSRIPKKTREARQRSNTGVNHIRERMSRSRLKQHAKQIAAAHVLKSGRGIPNKYGVDMACMSVMSLAITPNGPTISWRKKSSKIPGILPKRPKN